MTSTNKYWLFLLLALPLYLTWTFDHSLWNPDETRDAGIAAEMYRTSNWTVPTLNGVAFLEKPPLYYWSTALIYKLTGRVTAGTTRLPSALFGFLGVLFTFLIGKHLKGPRTGLFAAGILATAAQYFRMSHFATMDICLASMITGALYFYIAGSNMGFAAMTILAFYSKGFLGVVLPGLVVTLDMAVQKRWKDLLILIALCGVLFLAAVAPWIYGLWKSGGMEFLKVFFIDNHWKRFSSASADHANSPWYVYFASLPGDFLPWSFLLLSALWFLFKNWRQTIRDNQTRPVFIWLVSIFALLTLASSKRSIYLLPIFPPAALLSASLLESMAESGSFKNVINKWSFGLTAGLGLLASLAGCAAFFVIKKDIPSGILASLLAAGGFVMFFKSIRSTKLEQAIPILLLMVSATYASVSFSAMEKMDQDKSFLPVVNISLELAGQQGEIVGYDWSEMERGVFSFYFQKTLRNFLTPEELDNALKISGAKNIVLIANRNKKEVLEPFLKEKLKPEYEFRPAKKTRSYLIYSSQD